MSRIYECSNCGRWQSAMFVSYADKEVKFCPYCGSGDYLCEIKTRKKDENK